MKHGRAYRLAALLLSALWLCGCTASGTASGGGGYQIPPFRGDTFSEADAEDGGGIRVDLSQLEQGIVGVQVTSDARLKFQVVHGEEKYNYDLPGDGMTVFFPLNMGDGEYTFRLMEQVEDTRYSCSWSETRTVTLQDAFQPFLRPSQIVPYTEQSACVQKARELAADCDTDSELAAAVYRFLVENIRYDEEKAQTVTSGYLPDPDATLADGMGICFDYASLAAAMLRSMGVPCKVITGYVGETTYHAWNSFYLQSEGWVTAEIRVSVDQWQQVDITFAAGGVPDGQAAVDDSYTTRYVY